MNKKITTFLQLMCYICTLILSYEKTYSDNSIIGFYDVVFPCER